MTTQKSQGRVIPSTCHGISQVRQVVGGGAVEIEAALEQDQIRKDFADRVNEALAASINVGRDTILLGFGGDVFKRSLTSSLLATRRTNEDSQWPKYLGRGVTRPSGLQIDMQYSSFRDPTLCGS
ncbi:hypothetical protein VDBG_09660 [Verticillium alfalfae VaMs.102]|uniref:Uncharacterized protein n=1 Tax=Verticillium alfalfae (strain VaMs.102 / ATCC MYA-4576 / FGSC 10136) TaxID=526221 RepID=C9SX09_VERA1|nr:hypothetical protein VDBG_09660 [Verticillium alfalfae VaMs.102]EEY23550.1 hypothetical protein VDBG_09660 [Verticillium alfalfae VaMs.102]